MADRDSIPTATRLRLFSESAGHCQRPACLDKLFPDDLGGMKHIAEMAHVIPHGEKGPRHEERPQDSFDVDSFDNLLLFCPSCHSIVDKGGASLFPRDLLLGWKNNHLAALAQKQGLMIYETRREVRDAVLARQAENRAIWDKFAPSEGSEFEFDPESTGAKIWPHRMRSVILPNHYRIQAIIEMNLHHASEDERKVFAVYKEHVRGLAQRHVCDVAGMAIRFPPEMENIFE